MAERRIEFRILGPVEALVGGTPVPLGGPRQKAVLALLLLHAGEVVSADRLVTAVWGDEAPPTAAKSLQVHLSRLRRDLGFAAAGAEPPRIVTRAPGYALELAGDELDLRRFERLARRGRDELEAGNADRAGQTLREALGLWRGPALADLDLEPVAAAAASRIEEQRLTALEDRIDADLGAGRHAELVGELRGLVAEHPLRERLQAQLMLALYRAGRQGDALSAYQAARTHLADELGLEPGPRLRNLQRRILEQDPALDPREPPGFHRRSRRRLPAVALATAVAALAVLAILVVTDDSGRGPGQALPPRPFGNSVVRIDADTGRLTRVVRVGSEPDQLVVDRDTVWVANPGDRTVTRVDARTGRTDTVKGFTGVDRVATTPLGGLFVSSFERDVWEVSERTLVPRRLVRLPGHAEALAVGAGSLWVASPSGDRGDGGDSVWRYDPGRARVAQRFGVGATPLFMAFGYGRLWVSNYDGDALSVIDPGRARARTVPVGDGPLGIAAGEGAVWVVHYGERRLWRIDPVSGDVVARIPTGNGPLSVAAAEGWVWVTNREDGTVQQIDPSTNRVRRSVRLGMLAPYGVAVADGAAWVTLQGQPLPEG